MEGGASASGGFALNLGRDPVQHQLGTLGVDSVCGVYSDAFQQKVSGYWPLAECRWFGTYDSAISVYLDLAVHSSAVDSQIGANYLVV